MDAKDPRSVDSKWRKGGIMRAVHRFYKANDAHSVCKGLPK